jgi:hypothetical protein
MRQLFGAQVIVLRHRLSKRVHAVACGCLMLNVCSVSMLICVRNIF